MSFRNYLLFCLSWAGAPAILWCLGWAGAATSDLRKAAVSPAWRGLWILSATGCAGYYAALMLGHRPFQLFGRFHAETGWPFLVGAGFIILHGLSLPPALQGLGQPEGLPRAVLCFLLGTGALLLSIVVNLWVLASTL